MVMSVSQYLAQLQAMLPRGSAWPREDDATLTQVLRAWADELARVDGRAGALLREMDPRKTVEMLTDWEMLLGLPDACVPATSTLQARRDAVVSRLAAVGGQSPAYFEALALSIGVEVVVTEYRVFRAGRARAGDPVCGPEWAYTWRVTAQTNPYTYFRIGSSVMGERLRDWDGNLPLECVMTRYAPAHTRLIFGYLE